MLSRTQNRTLHTQISNHMQRTDRQLILQQRDTNLSISHPPQPIYSPIILSPSFASTPARTHSCALSITNCKKWVPQSWRARTDSSSATISGVWRSSLITPAALLLGFNGWVSLSNLFFFRWIRHCSAHFVWFVCLFWSYWRILLQFLAQHSMRFVFMAALFYSSFPSPWFGQFEPHLNLWSYSDLLCSVRTVKKPSDLSPDTSINPRFPSTLYLQFLVCWSINNLKDILVHQFP